MKLPFLLLTIFASSVNAQGSDWKCPKKTDIIFVLDKSGSINPADYNQMKRFLTIVADKLQIGVQNAEGDTIGQGAMVTFSEDPKVEINLQASSRSGAFVDAVNGLGRPLTGGRTKTALGLALADKEVAQRSAGFRDDNPDVKRMIMVITDGEQTPGKDYVPLDEAMQPFFDRDMEVFAVGVGLEKDEAKEEINDMVEDMDNAIFPESYSQLIDEVDEFVARFCPEPPPICGTERDDCHPTFATCADTGPNEYTCTCDRGYTGDGKTCIPVVICGTDRDDCHEYATCTDIGVGEYSCTCNEGYTGNGKSCQAINNCGTVRDDCHEYATCTNTGPGTHRCDCNEGYEGDGKIRCDPINNCGTVRDDCHQYATCTNTGPGTHRCDCNEGYEGDGKIRCDR